MERSLRLYILTHDLLHSIYAQQPLASGTRATLVGGQALWEDSPTAQYSSNFCLWVNTLTCSTQSRVPAHREELKELPSHSPCSLSQIEPPILSAPRERRRVWVEVFGPQLSEASSRL